MGFGSTFVLSLFVISFIGFLNGSTGVVVPLYSKKIGASLALIESLFMISHIVSTIVTPVIATLSDKVNRKYFAIVGCSIASFNACELSWLS